jgi:hypothetical protein
MTVRIWSGCSPVAGRHLWPVVQISNLWFVWLLRCQLKNHLYQGSGVNKNSNLKVFKNHGIGKIITNCPACAVVFKKDYPEVLGDKWDIEVQHITEIITPKKEIVNKESKKDAYFRSKKNVYTSN